MNNKSLIKVEYNNKEKMTFENSNSYDVICFIIVKRIK